MIAKTKERDKQTFFRRGSEHENGKQTNKTHTWEGEGGTSGVLDNKWRRPDYALLFLCSVLSRPNCMLPCGSLAELVTRGGNKRPRAHPISLHTVIGYILFGCYF